MSPQIPQTVEKCFELYAKKVELSLTDYNSICRGQAEVEESLIKLVSSFTTVLQGAFSRHTMINPLEDSVVDMLVLFNLEYKERALPTVLVGKLEEFFAHCFPGSIYQEKSVSVMVPVQNYWFRVQPGFISNQSHYFIPSPNWNDWMEYDSIRYKSDFFIENATHAGKLAPLVRIMKSWNRLSGDLFDGYYLELVVKDVLDSYQVASYSESLNHIFNAMFNEVVFKKDDPANPTVQVLGLDDLTDLILVMKTIRRAYRVSQQAIEQESDEDVAGALLNWEKLFPGLY